MEVGKVSKGIASDITHDAEFARELRLDRASLESDGLVLFLGFHVYGNRIAITGRIRRSSEQLVLGRLPRNVLRS